MEKNSNYALVTGASSGIGREIALILAGSGYPLIAVSNQAEGLAELKKQIGATTGMPVETLELDLAQENSAMAVYEFCRKGGFPVEVLVNCAGMLVYGEALRAKLERVRSILQLHMTTPALLCRLFAEGMIDRGKGYILNVSSISAVMPYPTISLYGPSKSFLRNFSRALRTELTPLGIRVCCLMPGAVDTALYEHGGFSIERGKRLGIVRSPASVARAGIRALFRNRAECIPGSLNRMAVRLFPLVPGFVVGLIYGRVRMQRERRMVTGSARIPSAESRTNS